MIKTEIYLLDAGQKSPSDAAYAFMSDYAKSRGAASEIVKDEYGKPYFDPPCGIFFSVSHSRRICMCAADSHPVGCDIQARRHMRPAAVRRICRDTELADFDFWQLWSLKESYIKLIGRREKNMRDIYFESRGGTVFSPAAPEVFFKLYPAPDGYVAAAASYCDDFPDSMTIICKIERE